jgi:hypothetical protein
MTQDTTSLRAVAERLHRISQDSTLTRPEKLAGIEALLAEQIAKIADSQHAVGFRDASLHWQPKLAAARELLTLWADVQHTTQGEFYKLHPEFEGYYIKERLWELTAEALAGQQEDKS